MFQEGKEGGVVVDIHSHIMPGLDDGAEDFDMTKEMIRMAYNEGCRHLFLTPHATSLNRRVTKILNSINEWISLEGIPIEVYMGSEVYIDVGEDEEDIKKIIKKLRKGKYLTLNNTRYVLIEFHPGGFELDKIAPIASELINAGYIPVIAHAEKYGVPYEYIYQLKTMGCKIQINLSDVFYEYKHEMVEIANKLLEAKIVDFVGTDAHRIDRRKPEIKVYVEYLYNNYSKEYVDDILYNNAATYLGLKTSTKIERS